MEDLLQTHFDSLSPSTRKALDILLVRMRECVRVSPFGSFEMSYASLLGLAATTMTYMIILLQFRV